MAFLLLVVAMMAGCHSFLYPIPFAVTPLLKQVEWKSFYSYTLHCYYWLLRLVVYFPVYILLKKFLQNTVNFTYRSNNKCEHISLFDIQ